MIYGDLLRQGVLKACDEVRGYKKNRKCNVDMCWWNSGVKNETQKKKDAYKEMTKNPTEQAKVNLE